MESFLMVEVADKALAIPIDAVRRALPAAKLSPPPDAGPVAGMLNLRGHMVPVVDLRPRLGTATKEMSTSDAIVLVKSSQGDVGIWVDRVLGVFSPISRTRRRLMGQELDAVSFGEQSRLAWVLDMEGIEPEG